MGDDRPSEETQEIPARRQLLENARRLFDESAELTSTAPRVPERIGPYRILERIGGGGMGDVYLAERTEPMRQRVAIKLIRLGMDTRELLNRFEAERQALALMEHSHIAKVFDAGADEQGRPYFVMEYVPGVSITEHCDRHRLGIKERLELFMQVSEAIQHAHQKGIIHRDIKPSNVLVTESEGKPSAKVIDFGIAKATQQKLTDATMVTEQGHFVGTPAYMSPEQAGGRAEDIDTRTDIYSLGVMLYELLVGATPFDLRALRGAMMAEQQRMIREVDPPRPSTRVNRLGLDSLKIAQLRRLDGKTLERQLRGDLDWIVMKAMEKDRTRRYASASEFAADIARHLRHEPVTAGPPSVLYRFSKFVRRHRVSVAAGLMVILALVVGLVATTTMYFRAERERQTTKQVKDFMARLFELSDPTEQRSVTITAKEVLDQGVAKIQTELKGQAVVQTELMDTMGRAYVGLGLYDSALALVEQGLQIRQTELAGDDLGSAASTALLGDVLGEKGEYDTALRLHEEVLATRRRLLGPDDPLVAESIRSVATVQRDLGNYDESIGLFQKALEIHRKAFGAEHRLIATCLRDLAFAYEEKGAAEEAESMYRQALAMHQKVLGDDHFDVALDINHLAKFIHVVKGDLEEGEKLYDEAIRRYRKTLADDHPHLAAAYNNLAALCHKKGDFNRAEEIYRRVLPIHRKIYGDNHTFVAGDLTGLAAVLRDSGRLTEAEPLYREALAMRETLLGTEHPMVAVTLSSLGQCKIIMGHFPEAEEFLLRAFRIQSTALGNGHVRTRDTLDRLVRLYETWEKPDQAEHYRSLLRESAPENP